MMQCWVRLGGGQEWKLPTLMSWEMCYGTDTPCDSFSLRCLWERGQEKVLSGACRFYAEWEGERVFTGVVDEFAVLCGKDGLYLEMAGRGMAALLLDNEAMPAEYQRATRADIIANHVAPYGVQTVGGMGLPAITGFLVSSGESEWSVVRRYACYYGGVVPRFDRMGRLVLDPHADAKVVCVGDKDKITGWEYREERHGVLSQVAVRRRTTWGTQWVSDPAFIAQGGRARRVITVPNTTGTTAMRYTADYQLRAARRERVRMRLTAAGGFLAWPGDLVDVALEGFGANGRYRAAQVEVSCGGGGLTTTLVLGEVGAMI
jgi:prophage tail gpP-like protein